MCTVREIWSKSCANPNSEPNPFIFDNEILMNFVHASGFIKSLADSDLFRWLNDDVAWHCRLFVCLVGNVFWTLKPPTVTIIHVIFIHLMDHIELFDTCNEIKSLIRISDFQSHSSNHVVWHVSKTISVSFSRRANVRRSSILFFIYFFQMHSTECSLLSASIFIHIIRMNPISTSTFISLMN